MDDGRHRRRDERDRQGIDSAPNRRVDTGMLVIASIVVTGNTGFGRMVRDSRGVMMPLVMLTVMCNPVRERCHRGGYAGREQNE